MRNETGGVGGTAHPDAKSGRQAGRRRAALAGLLLPLIAAGCADSDPTWYEARCMRIGLSPGTPEFAQCTARDRAWIEENRMRVIEQGGGP
ncbi:MAG TPA: hypothetical protein VE631_03915, partial [Alphaproteobacteria bacterium]|nr:hypothetical protein [Alphaproteobacteria bacterium]